MTTAEIRIKESELKYTIGNLVDNLICYKAECESQADQITELEKENEELQKQIKKIKRCANCNTWLRNDDIKHCKKCPNLEGVKILRGNVWK